MSVDARFDGLTSVSLGHVENGVFCGPGHALHGRRDVSEEELLTYPFAAPPEIDGRAPEGWPSLIERQVRWRSARMEMGIRLCETGLCLAVFPVPVGRTEGLWQLTMSGLPKVPLVAVRRNVITPDDLAGLFIELVQDAYREL
jgi:DNA-binding transcriptional LysR family regulator